MFQNFLSLNENQLQKKKKCLPHSYCIAEACDLSRARRPAALSGKAKLNEASLLFAGEMKKELLTSVKCRWVGAFKCACYRFLAIDDLSEKIMKLHIYQ